MVVLKLGKQQRLKGKVVGKRGDWDLKGGEFFGKGLM